MSPASRTRLSELADALSELLVSGVQREIARQLGMSHSTPGDRGSNPDAWTISQLKELGELYPQIDEALANLFTSPAPPPLDSNAETHVRDLIGAMGGQIQRLIARLDRDGLDDAELRATDTDMASLQAQITQARAVIRIRRRQH
jgi:hypothetical protein